MGSYKASIEERDYEVTAEQRAAHLHILNNTVPVRKDLSELVLFLGRYGAVDGEEAQKLRDAVQVLDGLCIPMALLTVVEDPREAAKAQMFSNMLRSRRADDEEESTDAPGMRR
jgi:hypothetical protein